MQDKKRGRFIVRTIPNDSSEVKYLVTRNNQSAYLGKKPKALEGIYNIPSPLSPWNWDNKVVLLTDTLTSIEGPLFLQPDEDVDWGSATNCSCIISQCILVPWKSRKFCNNEQFKWIVNTETT